MCASAAHAQLPSFAGHYQNVGIEAAAQPGVGAGALDAQRLRLMWTPSFGAVTLDAAYEHTLWWSGTPGLAAGGGLLSSTRAGGDWMHLGWIVHHDAHVDWQQRFDRLSLAYTRGSLTATIGRQAVSWATTLMLTPADPFVPFDPSDPFREYRTGIDAARVQWFPGPFTVLDFVVRPTDAPDGRTITALARGKTTLRGWEISAWGGALYDRPAGALGVTRTLLGSAIRGETEFRRDSAGRPMARIAVGIDRRFRLFDRDLYAVLEYQRDPFGASRASDLPTVELSRAAVRREMQVFGRDESALQIQYQVHPLVSAELTSLWNLRDGSTLFAPDANISLSNESSARIGLYLPAGPGHSRLGGPRSEYGAVPLTGFAALDLYF